MGGSASSVVSAVVNPYAYVAGKVASKATGQDIKLEPAGIVTNQLIDKPKEMKDEISKQIKEQEDAARRAEEEYKKEQTDAKKQARDIALQNLQRTQARLRSQQPSQKGGYSGTILTSPLGVSGGDTNAGTSQKTLLGY